jgi:hypothetical protein
VNGLRHLPARTLRAVALAGICLGAGCFDFEDFVLRGYEGSGDGGELPDGSFVCKAPVPGGACGIAPECGCLPWQACDILGPSGVTGCIDDKGLARGELCDGLFQGCGMGLTCVGNTCKRFCSSGRSCGPEAACYQVYSEGGPAIPGMKVCTDPCDLMAPHKGCGEGAACYPFDAIGLQPGRAVCRVAGTSASTCQVNEDCSAARGCGEDGLCRLWCRAGEPFDCTPPLKCGTVKKDSVTGYFFVGEQAYGVCTL